MAGFPVEAGQGLEARACATAKARTRAGQGHQGHLPVGGTDGGQV